MSKKIKILFLVPNLEGGGSERVVSLLANYINRQDFTPTIVLLQKKGIYLQQIEEDVRIIDLNIKRVRYAGLALIQLIKKEKPDLVLSTLGHMNLLLATLKFLMPSKTTFIARESSTVSLRNRDENFPLLFNLLFKTVYKSFDQIVCQCNYMADDLKYNFGIKPDKLKVINNPISVDVALEKSKEAATEIIDEKKVNFVFVGRFSKEKRADHVLKAFARFAQPNKHHLFIIGDGVLKDELKNLAGFLSISPMVSFLGLIKNPFPYMAKASCLISTSLYEGFPNVVLEANACGTPVIAYDYPGGLKEIVANNENGLIVNNGNIEALSSAMQSFDKAKFNSTTISVTTREKFGVSKILQSYEEAFKLILKEKQKQTTQ